MNTRCSYMHLSYAKWRLRVLNCLYRNTEASAEPQLPFLHPWLHDPRCGQRRDFHKSNLRARNLLKDVRRTAKHKAVQLELKECVKPENQSGTSKDIETSSQGIEVENDKPWNPYSDNALGAMQGLVEELRAKAVEVAAKEKDGEEEDVPFVGRTFKRQNNKLRSPLEFRLPWDRPSKLQAHEVESDRKLENNIWAQMLASPVRMDRGMRARLPRDLTMSWGVMHNPHNDMDYLVPIELSDLAALKKELVQDDGGDTQHLTDEVQADDARSADRHSSPRFAMVPDKLLVATMTERFTTTKHDRRGNVTSHSIMSEHVRTQLVPYRWRLKQDELKAFARTRQTFYKTLDRQPDADEPILEDMTNFEKLQWQFDIEDRIMKLVTTRVLLAIEAVGKDNTSGRAIHDRRVVAIPVPSEDRITLDHKGRMIASDTSQFAKSSEETGKTEDTVGIESPEWVHGAIVLYVGKPESFHQQIEQWTRHQSSSSPLPQLPPYDLVPPMIAINEHFRIPVFNLEELFGGDQSHRFREMVAANPILTQDFWQQYDADPRGSLTSAGFEMKQDKNPAGSNTGTNIIDSTLDAGDQVLSSIVTPTTAASSATIDTPAITTTSSSPARSLIKDARSTEQETDTPYLLLIKPKAKHAPVLIREIWQMWRYTGGRPNLSPAGTETVHTD